jgi:hypothetical protein
VQTTTGKETGVIARPEAQEWFFFKAGSDAGLKAGPFSWERLVAQAQSGILEPTDVVWDPNSGWKTAAKVPGLFPAVPIPGMVAAYPDTPALESSSAGSRRSRVYWLSGLAVLVIVGGGLGSYFGLAHDGGGVAATTTTSAVTTTVSGVTTTVSAVTTTQSTATTVTQTTVAAGAPVVRLGKADFGHPVRLKVGDHVRIDLQPWIGDKVKSVVWDYRPGIVQQTGSGSDKAGSAIVATWIELEAVAAGPVTVRAEYQYPNGTARAIWVIYLFVE